jgi:sialic acid synthase
MSLSLTTNIKRLLNRLPAKVKVQTFYVGEGRPVFVIAEIGNNHNGDFELAKRSILAAKEAGADAVKFQKRDMEELLSKEMRDMPYVNERSFGKTYGEHRAKQELSKEQYIELKEYSESLGVVFFATPFDKASADVLESIGVHAYKIASFDVTNLPLLIHVAKKDKPILLSTGASTLEEMDAAIETILSYNNRLIVNHCTSLYPTPDDHIDLRMVNVLKERYRPLPVGYSGHELDILATVASIALGASTVERHFTLDKKMHGSDHHMSIEPREFKEMVSQIRRMEVLLGSDSKRVYSEEVPIRHKHGKSIVSSRDIPAGAILSEELLTFKIPGHGINPAQIDMVLGRKAKVMIPADTIIKMEFLQ